MIKIYILALCCLTCASGLEAASRFKSSKGSHTARIAKVEPGDPVWRPGSAAEYVYDEGGWLLIGEMKYTYDCSGNVLTETIDADGERSKTVYTRNEYGKPMEMLASVYDGATSTWIPSQKRTWEYDPVVHDFFTMRRGYNYDGGQWIENFYTESNIITRNTDGNITGIEKLLPLDGSLLPAYKMMWHYNESTGRADEFGYYMNITGNDWILYDDTYYKNIVWDTTDGQMTESDISDYVEGANRILSADVYYMDELDGHYFVEYPTTYPGNYLIKETTADPQQVGRTQELVYTDEYGSSIFTETEYFNDEGEITTEPVYTWKEVETIDSYGNIIATAGYEIMDGEEMMVAAQKAEYTYNENGNPTEVVSSWYDIETGEWVIDNKVEYSDYVDASGVDNISTDESAGEHAEYFNLQGRRVLNPSQGLYIVRQGNKAYKVYIR